MVCLLGLGAPNHLGLQFSKMVHQSCSPAPADFLLNFPGPYSISPNSPCICKSRPEPIGVRGEAAEGRFLVYFYCFFYMVARRERTKEEKNI